MPKKSIEEHFETHIKRLVPFEEAQDYTIPKGFRQLRPDEIGIGKEVYFKYIDVDVPIPGVITKVCFQHKRKANVSYATITRVEYDNVTHYGNDFFAEQRGQDYGPRFLMKV